MCECVCRPVQQRIQPTVYKEDTISRSRPNEGKVRRTDGPEDGRTDGWTDGQTSGRTDRRVDGRTDEWTDGQTGGRRAYHALPAAQCNLTILLGLSFAAPSPLIALNGEHVPCLVSNTYWPGGSGLYTTYDLSCTVAYDEAQLSSRPVANVYSFDIYLQPSRRLLSTCRSCFKCNVKRNSELNA